MAGSTREIGVVEFEFRRARLWLGISLKTQELYALVFLARYLDLFTDFISIYNTAMKLIFIASSLATVWCMRAHPVVRRSYDGDQDTFRHHFLVLLSFILALLFHDLFTIREVTCIFLTAIRLPCKDL